MVKSFRDWYQNKAKSLSESMTSKLKNSARRISIYRSLARTLHWLNGDRELEKLVDGIPSLCLPLSTIQLAQRTFTSKLPKSVQRRNSGLLALYYIPGAIRSLLAPYAAGGHHFLETLPLLNSPESLEITDEWWDTPNDDVALSVRCAAAVVAAFMITPQRRTLDNFVTPNVGFIWDDNTGKQSV
ncbi:hypothetical protein EDB85DRAFT_1893881 [Lactarius pseudohatsudake]|nr:hypothetical protein EDB85DRAFT_1893881 [Lactarius pseudohatsudake]